ncbi:MAG: alpha amylase C-terminal domain-containing protein, partial [Corynebacterium sp.]|uniref:alpha amylase C-terminal domain-containing protein n=1 Tax=Corynebacterium sp. TaxID=1720 RepID=UPI0026E0C060
FGQTGEWNEAYSIDWSNLEGWGHEFHAGIKDLVKDIHWVYRSSPALYSQDHDPAGFQWIKGDDAANNLLAYVRWGNDGSALLSVINLSGTSQPAYKLGIPRAGDWELVLNTDDAKYQGAGNNIAQVVSTDNEGWDGQEHSLTVHIPANSVQWYRHRGGW